MGREVRAPRERGGLYIDWDPVNNMPVPVDAPMMNNQQVTAVVRSSMSTMYEPKGRWVADPETNEDVFVINKGEERFIGMTCLEVAEVRQAINASHGDLDSLNHLLDRTVGKPKQLTETITMNVTLQEALDSIGDSLIEKGKLDPKSFMDVTDVTETTSGNDYVDPMS